MYNSSSNGFTARDEYVSSESNKNNHGYASQEPGMRQDARAYKCDDSYHHVNYKMWPWTKKMEYNLSDSQKYSSEPQRESSYEFRQAHTQLFQQYQKCLSDTKCEIECDKYLNKAVWLDSRFKDSLY
jgi:hypothetical protein